MAETTRWGLEKTGGPYGGAITDDGSKYTTTDRDLIDKLLAFFETHKHDGGSNPVALASPTLVPSATQHSTGGTIARGTTRFYKFTLVDQFGFESVGSPELAVTLPSTIAVIVAPVVTGDTGGSSTLAEGAYYYALTGNTVDGETILGPEAILTVQTGQNQADLTLPALPSGVDSWNVWRMGVTEQGWTKVFDSQAPGSLVDVGYASGDCLCDPTTQPPTVDLVASGSYSVTITPDPDDLASATSWRLYESDTSGSYGSASLVAAVVPTVVGNPPPSSYLDTGSALLAGQPPLVSNTIKPSHAVSGGGGGGGGGEDSHWVAGLADQALADTSGAHLPAYFIEWATNDVVGFDIVPAYEPTGFSDGDMLQVDTSAVYSIFGTLNVVGAAPGDVYVLGMVFEQAPTAHLTALAGLYPTRLGQLVIPPGGSNFALGFALPAVYLPEGTLVSFYVESYYSTGGPTQLQASAGIQMASGTPRDAELYPAPADLVVTDAGSGGALSATWTVSGSDTDYVLMAYDPATPGPPVDKVVDSGTGTATLSGLTDDTAYDVVLLARKGIGGVTMVSTAAIGTATPTTATPSVGPLTDTFDRSDSPLSTPDWVRGFEDPDGVIGIVATGVRNTGSGTGPAVVLHDLGADNKHISFSHQPSDATKDILVVLAATTGLGNPQAIVSWSGDGTAPVIDHYSSGGTHTAVTMTAAAGFASYVGANALIEFDLHGTQIEMYVNHVLAYTAVLPSACTAAPWCGFGLFPWGGFSAGGGSIDNWVCNEFFAPAVVIHGVATVAGALSVIAAPTDIGGVDTGSSTTALGQQWGIAFQVSAPATVTGMSVFNHSPSVTIPTGLVLAVGQDLGGANTILASKATAGATPVSAAATIVFDTPVSLTTGVWYFAAITGGDMSDVEGVQDPSPTGVVSTLGHNRSGAGFATDRGAGGWTLHFELRG